MRVDPNAMFCAFHWSPSKGEEIEVRQLSTLTNPFAGVTFSDQINYCFLRRKPNQPNNPPKVSTALLGSGTAPNTTKLPLFCVPMIKSSMPSPLMSPAPLTEAARQRRYQFESIEAIKRLNI